MNTTQLENKQSDILIVDDIQDNIRFLSAFLVEQGYTVRKSINGQMALRAVNALVPDLILLDVNLPDISGYEVCHHLKENSSTSSIPIIFLSAGSEAIDKVKAFQMGAVDYITKPFHLEEVLIRIQTQLTIQALQKELKEQNGQLKQALTELKVVQANLVQQEKMATLKKVVAGVTHEINNPLSFIACNVKPAQEYINQLLTLIELYQQKSSGLDPAIEVFLKEINLEFIALDLMNIINSIGNGANRIHAVVLALQIFTHLDKSGVKQINLRESINSILPLLQHRINSRSDGVVIQIKEEYEELPLITCHADHLNQVVFNLMCNAIDAIDEKIKSNSYQDLTPQISIHTHLIGKDRVIVRIKDNGIGISEDDKSHIFEPFFTTKSAGQGVGLGLATSRRIVEEMHGGSLTYCSSVGEGAEFVIQIPI